MARAQITNPQPLIALKYNPYQQGFLSARRLRVCPKACAHPDSGIRLTWSMLDGAFCPVCHELGFRAYRRLYLRAGRQSGKTRAGGLSAIEESMVPNSIGWCSAPSYPELRDYVIPAFMSQFPQEIFEHPQCKWSEDRLSLVTPWNSEVHFRSLDDPNRATGATLDWWWIDEGRKIQELAWHLGEAMLAIKKGVCWVTSSPDWGEDWCHRNFWAPAEAGMPGYWAASYKTVDSPVIDPAIIEAARLVMPPELFRREYEASIEFPTGTIYGDVINKCEADDDRIRKWLPEWPKVSPNRPCWIVLDPGTDHPFAAGYFIGCPQGIVMVGEYAERNKRYVQHVEGIKGIGGDLAIDPKAAPLTGRWFIDRSQKQAALELMQYGVYAQGAENDVDAGIERVYSWMASNRFLISKTRCPRTLKDLRRYRYADVPEGTRGLAKPTPFKKDDDLPDVVRYFCMSYPELPTRGLEIVLPPGVRDLSVMNPDDRRQVERMLDHERAGQTDGDLVRVTDDFRLGPNDDILTERNPIGDFYG
jgi:hypothetical protein